MMNFLYLYIACPFALAFILGFLGKDFIWAFNNSKQQWSKRPWEKAYNKSYDN